MSVEHLGGKGYARLPQSISNTDTEDEEEHLSQPIDTGMKDLGGTTVTDTNAVRQNGRFYPLDETRNLSSRTRNGRNMVGYCGDDIPIMVIDGDAHDDLWKRRDMSPLRRFCLVISILLCVATIFIFLYALPCDDSVTCPPIPERQPALSWDKTLEGVELHGPVSIVPGSPYNLIFLLRGQRYKPDNPGDANKQQIPSDGGGVISLDGNSEQPSWWVRLKRLPTEINCTALDVNGSGKPDCLVAGEQGLLVGIDRTAGTIHWSSAAHTYPKLPALLPDVDSDGIDDLLSVEIVAEPSLVVLSGRSGQFLGRYSIRDCASINIDSLDTNATVSYSCHDTNGKQSRKSIHLQELLDSANLSGVQKQLALKPKVPVRAFVARDSRFEECSVELSPYHRLTIENRGTCPGETCESSVNLTLENVLNESRSIWSHVGQNSFAMEPAIITAREQPYVIGFAMKFWQWNDVDTEPDKVSSNFTKRRITERVLMVLTNQTDVRAANVSQSELMQLCRGEDCQPSLQLQTRSIAIADLNGDGSRELISYQTSYSAENLRVLTSKVQIVRLDAEMAMLTQREAIILR